MAIFNSYVSLPEGIEYTTVNKATMGSPNWEFSQKKTGLENRETANTFFGLKSFFIVQSVTVTQ